MISNANRRAYAVSGVTQYKTRLNYNELFATEQMTSLVTIVSFPEPPPPYSHVSQTNDANGHSISVLHTSVLIVSYCYNSHWWRFLFYFYRIICLIVRIQSRCVATCKSIALVSTEYPSVLVKEKWNAHSCGIHLMAILSDTGMISIKYVSLHSYYLLEFSNNPLLIHNLIDN